MSPLQLTARCYLAQLHVTQSGAHLSAAAPGEPAGRPRQPAAQESSGEKAETRAAESWASELRPLRGRCGRCAWVQAAGSSPASGWASGEEALSRAGNSPAGCRLRPHCPGRLGGRSLSPSLQIYPDGSHYFHSARLRQHLYGAIVNFFAECFRVQDKAPAAPAKEEEEEED